MLQVTIHWTSMCGIALVLEASAARCAAPGDSAGLPAAANGSYGSEGPLSRALEMERRLRQRGPDQHDRRLVELEGWTLALHAAVLHLRGPQVVEQPVEDEEGNVLCWNGEAFGGLEEDEERDLETVLNDSDTEKLMAKLSLASRLLQAGGEGADPVVQVLRRVRGPFGVIYVHRRAQRVYFAHDRFGRRSLLYAMKQQGEGEQRDIVAEVFDKSEAEQEFDFVSTNFTQRELQQLCLSSVAVKNNEGLVFKEVPSTGIFVLDLSSTSEDTTYLSYRIEFHPHDRICDPDHAHLASLAQDMFGCHLPITTSTQDSELNAAANALLIALSNAVGIRVRSIPRADSNSARVGVLFSGGLDSVVLAALTHFHLPPSEPVDLLTVCFDSASGFQSPDRLAAQLSHKELQTLFPSRAWNLVCVNIPYDDVVSNERDIAELLTPCDTHMDFNIGAAFWFLSRGAGKLESHEADGSVPNASVGELNAFLRPDATLKASYALDDAVSALELFADGNKEIVSATGMIECPASNCRRKKKKSSCRFGVCRVCCLKLQKLSRKLLSFRADQSSIDEREASKAVATLLAMGLRNEKEVDTLLDVLEQDTDGCRAHRPKQSPNNEPSTNVDPPKVDVKAPKINEANYQSPVRVLLVGIGADEQLGGYGRHRTAYRAGGSQQLRKELTMDMARIWKRNLGRDDRCISAHGREARFPFLDEKVVETIAQLPLDCICDFELERGEGDKRVLRVAAQKLGLESCTRLAKRAIQFGSRIAKHANARAFGSQRQATGDAKFLVDRYNSCPQSMGVGASVALQEEALRPLDASDVNTPRGESAKQEVTRLRMLLAAHLNNTDGAADQASSEQPATAETMAPGLEDYLASLFRAADVDMSGVLSAGEFWQLLQGSELGLTPEQIVSLQQQTHWNSESGDVTWAGFVELAPQILANLVAANGETDPAIAESTEVGATTDDPADWCALTSSDGTAYYYNKRTQESSWAPPTSWSTQA